MPDHIANQGELDAWEQQNILEGRDRLATRGPGELLTDTAIKTVHSRMFDKTWRWAGKYRQSNTNIGVDWAQIAEQVRVLCDDAKYQREHKTYSPDELAARFHHRLVSVHPFPNGNGRLSRQMADMLLESLGQKSFSWGSANLGKDGDARKAYLDALRAADKGDLGPLLHFVRS